MDFRRRSTARMEKFKIKPKSSESINDKNKSNPFKPASVPLKGILKNPLVKSGGIQKYSYNKDVDNWGINKIKAQLELKKNIPILQNPCYQNFNRIQVAQNNYRRNNNVYNNLYYKTHFKSNLSNRNNPEENVILLQPLFESSESAFATESGGNVDNLNHEMTDKIVTTKDSKLQCPHCPKSYIKEVPFEKHLLKHSKEDRRKFFRARSNSKCSSRWNGDVEIVLQCPSCHIEFNNRKLFRKHLDTHRERFSCKDCGAGDYFNRDDYEFHLAMCDGQKRAMDTRSCSGSVRTRSQSRKLRKPSDDIDNTNNPDIMSLARINYIRNWLSCTPNREILVDTDTDTDDEDDDDDDDGENINNMNERDTDDIDENEPDLDEDDDNASCYSGFTGITGLSRTTDKTYSSTRTNSTHRTGRSSISISCRKSYKQAPPVHQSDEDLQMEIEYLGSRKQTRSIKERLKRLRLDLTLRDNGFFFTQKRRNMRRFIKRQQREDKGEEKYYCNDCLCYTTDSLKEIMLHESIYHSILSLYVCMECNMRFTQLHYLKRHLEDHITGPFMCIHCETLLDDKNDLNVHINLHSMRDNKCEYCDLSFLKETELEQHIIALHCDANGEIVAKKNETNICIIARTDFGKADITFIRSFRQDMKNYRVRYLKQKACEKKRNKFYGYRMRLGDAKRIKKDILNVECSRTKIVIPSEINEDNPVSCIHRDFSNVESASNIEFINEFSNLNELSLSSELTADQSVGKESALKKQIYNYSVRDDFTRCETPDIFFSSNEKEYTFDEEELSFIDHNNSYSHFKLDDHKLFATDTIPCLRECTNMLSITCSPETIDQKRCCPRINGRIFKFDTTSTERTLIALTTVVNTKTSTASDGTVTTITTKTTTASDPRITPGQPDTTNQKPPRIDLKSSKRKSQRRYMYNILFNNNRPLPSFDDVFYTPKTQTKTIIDYNNGPWRIINYNDNNTS